MRKALVVGVDHYHYFNDLTGCVNDAMRITQMLKRNGDNSLNFDVKELCGCEGEPIISTANLKSQISELFNTSCDVALFYFAGHGFVNEEGGFIVTSECNDDKYGIPLSLISDKLKNSKAENNIVILDCCNAGIMAKNSFFGDSSIVPPNTTFLLACKEDQYSKEKGGNGVFTDLLIDALTGGAANLIGEISPGSIYSYIDKALGMWEQRPVFKTNVEHFISIRKVKPPINLDDLRKINQLFPNIAYEFPLNSTFEPTSKNSIEENTAIFSLLQKYNRLNLVVPVGADHMYYAAMEEKSCKLTALGIHYWNLVDKDRI